VEALLEVNGRSSEEIMGHPDYLKLKSSMTLFELVDVGCEKYGALLERYYEGERDSRTIECMRGPG
jgi:uncharacterized protein (DUF1810 family)